MMKHAYIVTGMSCGGCKSHVEHALNSIEGVESVQVELESGKVTIEMSHHIELTELQNALEGSSYQIHLPDSAPSKKKVVEPTKKGSSSGIYYCPMHCEGDKTYTKPGDCP